MTEFREQDLTGARFERVSLRCATFTSDARTGLVLGHERLLNEEWEHRLYAEHDLTALEKGN